MEEERALMDILKSMRGQMDELQKWCIKHQNEPILKETEEGKRLLINLMSIIDRHIWAETDATIILMYVALFERSYKK